MPPRGPVDQEQRRGWDAPLNQVLKITCTYYDYHIILSFSFSHMYSVIPSCVSGRGYRISPVSVCVCVCVCL